MDNGRHQPVVLEITGITAVAVVEVAPEVESRCLAESACPMPVLRWILVGMTWVDPVGAEARVAAPEVQVKEGVQAVGVLRSSWSMMRHLSPFLC